jgi:tetratricopeptide (TPR) repeat protein
MFCAPIALRYAMARDFTTHRRWALRLFLVASASWFFRLGFFLTLVLFGPIGFDPTTFSGPLLTFWSLAQYLLPLGVLELYLRAQEHTGALRRMATAGVLFVLTLGMGAGIGAVTMASWMPNVKAAMDPRKSIAQALSATITSSGIDAAVKQYRELKAAVPGTYKFNEAELNNLGYTLIRENKFKEAIRIFQLNVEAFPQSGNTYDSLAEGYMDDGDKALAIANYQKSLQLNPKNRNAGVMLQKLNAPPVPGR